jgi:hypothetical protein
MDVVIVPDVVIGPPEISPAVSILDTVPVDAGAHVWSPRKYVVLSAVPVPRLNVGIRSTSENGIILPSTFFNGRGKMLILVAKIVKKHYIWA